jgi:preprotein translocase SecE subunit
MARNRQKAKERQARRKAEGRAGDGKAGAPADKAPRAARPAQPEPVEPDATEAETANGGAAEPDVSDNGRDEDTVVDPDIVDPHLRAGAPPETVGRSDEVLEYEQDLEASSSEEESVVPAADIAEHDVSSGPRGHRAGAEQHAHRPRFVQFLFAVWAELQRVQWPDRQALTTLTAIVLGFVVIAGSYLGLLDAVVSRIVQAIL